MLQPPLPAELKVAGRKPQSAAQSRLPHVMQFGSEKAACVTATTAARAAEIWMGNNDGGGGEQSGQARGGEEGKTDGIRKRTRCTE